MSKLKLKWFIWSLIALYFCWATCVFTLQRYFFFPAYLAAEKGGIASRPGWVQQWDFTIAEGSVHAWYAPGIKTGEFYESLASRASPSVIFAHGNGEQMEQQLSIMRKYREAGVNILVIEYRGYGDSDGSPSEANILYDLKAAYKRLLDQPMVDSSQVFFHGRSMGTGVMCSFTGQLPPAGLILESPYLSLKGFYPQLGVPRFFARDPFDSVNNIRSYDGPSVVFHGSHDELIPFAHGEVMAKVLQGEFYAFDAGHNDIPREARYWNPVFQMIRTSGARP